jgi:hypothetical protein
VRPASQYRDPLLFRQGVAQSARLNINLRACNPNLKPARTWNGRALELGTLLAHFSKARRPTRLVARRGLPRSFAPSRPITAAFRDAGLLPRRPRLAASWLLLRWPCWSFSLLPLLPLLPCPSRLLLPAGPGLASHSLTYSPPSRTPPIVPSPLHSTSPPPTSPLLLILLQPPPARTSPSRRHTSPLGMLAAALSPPLF